MEKNRLCVGTIVYVEFSRSKFCITCGMYPISDLFFTPIRMVPASSDVKPTIQFNNVVFPQPLGPNNA